MDLTPSNYYSAEANAAYWSASFVKSMLRCQAEAMAELRGDYVPSPSMALLVGSFVDAWFDGRDAYDAFAHSHPEIINSRTGSLKAEFRTAQDMIDRARRDQVFMRFCEGEHQHIAVGEIGGLPFKGKFDFYVPGKRIVDLKTVRDMEPVYMAEQGKVSFAEAWNWPLQMAIYQQLEGHRLPCYLAVITKQDPPDIAVIEIPQHVMDAEMELLATKLPMLDAVRQGVIEPERCDLCSYCRGSRKLTGPISLDELTEL